MPKPKGKERDYTTVSIPIPLANRIDKYVKREDAIYKSRVDFTLSAIRKELEELNLLEPYPMLEHFNLNERGVIIADKNRPKRDQLCQIQFTRKGIKCEKCNDVDCVHIEYAMTKPDIQRIIRKKRLEGWELP